MGCEDAGWVDTIEFIGNSKNINIKHIVKAVKCRVSRKGVGWVKNYNIKN